MGRKKEIYQYIRFFHEALHLLHAICIVTGYNNKSTWRVQTGQL